MLKLVYNSLPSSLQNLAVSAYGYGWRRRRFGGIFSEELKGFKDREEFTEEQWLHYESDQLVKLLTHAYEAVPFYGNSLKGAGIALSDLKRIDKATLNRLPFLEKKDLRAFGKTDLISSSPEKGGEFFS